MGKPAARISDMHTCPMFDGPKPHVGGPIMPPGTPTVLIGGLPAATATNMCTCVGPPDMIALGSTGVLIGGLPAARMGDMTAHGGVIVAGMPTVLIGEGGGGSAAAAAAKAKAMEYVYQKVDKTTQAAIKTKINFLEAARTAKPVVHNGTCCSTCKS